MSRGPRGLALRLYVITLAQLFTVIAAALVVHRLTIGAPPMPPMHRGVAQYALGQVLARAHDPAAMRAELLRARRELRAEITLYSATGTVTASNVEPPLPLLPGRGGSPEPDDGWAPDAPPPDRPGAPPFGGRPRFDGPPPDPRFDGPPPNPRFGRPPPMPRGRPLVVPLAGGGHAVISLGRAPSPPPSPPISQLAWGVVLALVIVGVASMLQARSFARPLAQLSAAAREIGRGNLGVRVKLRRTDELGELSDAFDDMTERLALLLRAQQELMANVSHELRTPLARIGVALDLAAEGDADMAREALGEIAEDVAELQRLVADVLRMARLDLAEGRTNAAIPPVRPNIIDPLPLLEKAVVRFRSAYPERSVELTSTGALPQISADPVLLRRVIDNLLDNARKYSEGPVALRAEAKPDAVIITVEDHGIGIAPEDIPNVATPFFRTDRSRARKTGGLGLGLSLARRITEAHGGTLVIESELGVGTTVRVTLPPLGSVGAPPPAISSIASP